MANKPDSQEICFVANNDYAGFIQEYLEDEDNKRIIENKKVLNMKNTEAAGYGFTPGNFVDTKGNILGKHRGLAHYTIGQRKGLNIALGRPVFVMKLNADTNEVVLGGRMYIQTVFMKNLNFMAIEYLQDDRL